MGFARERDVSRKADSLVGQYLARVQQGDHAGADALLCGRDDTSIAGLPATAALTSSQVGDAKRWSSIVDGGGRRYRAHLSFADGSQAEADLAVESIGDIPCIATEIPF